MATMKFGEVVENVVTREEFPLDKAREVLKSETIAVIGYGVQGPGQSLNLRDNGFNVIVGPVLGSIPLWGRALIFTLLIGLASRLAVAPVRSRLQRRRMLPQGRSTRK